jgi:membrane-associated protein
LLGFFLGKTLPAEQLDKYLLPIIGLIVVVSLLPSVIHIIKENRANK